MWVTKISNICAQWFPIAHDICCTRNVLVGMHVRRLRAPHCSCCRQKTSWKHHLHTERGRSKRCRTQQPSKEGKWAQTKERTRVQQRLATPPACDRSLSGPSGEKCSGSVPRGVFGAPECPKSVPGVSRECPRSVRTPFGTLSGHFWTLWSPGPEGPQRHPEGRSRNTSLPKGRETPVAGRGGCNKRPQRNASGKKLQTTWRKLEVHEWGQVANRPERFWGLSEDLSEATWAPPRGPFVLENWSQNAPLRGLPAPSQRSSRSPSQCAISFPSELRALLPLIVLHLKLLQTARLLGTPKRHPSKGHWKTSQLLRKF